MLDFANSYSLFLLFTVPAVIFLYFLSRSVLRRNIKRFGRPSVVRRLMPEESKYKPPVKLILCLIALVAIVLVMARPRYGEKEDIISTEGSEIVIAFDVSRSMLAPSTDDPGSMSRIERARMLLEKLVNDMPNDKVGLVVFAANARMQMPLTSDRRIIQMALRNDLTPGMMSNQGTSISQAIEMSTLSFPALRQRLEEGEDKIAQDNVGTHRAIILITDAEDHEGDAIEVAKQAADMGIQIDVIGVGTELGGKIPLGNGANMLDFEGNEVITKLNSEAASQIAQAGNGVYVNAADNDALQILQKSLDDLKKSEFESVNYKMSAEQFPFFAWIALIFLVLEILILESKTTWLRGTSIFRHKTIAKRKNLSRSK